MSLEGSEALRAARGPFLAWIFEFRCRPTGGYPRLRAALVFLLRMFWFWIVGARRFLLCRPTGGFPRLRAALVFLLRMFWFWIVGARRFLLFRPTGGASLPGSRFLGSCQIVYVLLPAFLPPPVYRSWPAPVDPASQSLPLP